MFRNKPESDLNRAVRQHSEAVREERNAQANDRRREQGLPEMHCGTPATTNQWGDPMCGRCGNDF